MTQFTLDNPKLAETYDRISDPQFERGSQLVTRLGLRPSDVVLDIGSGTGRLGLHVLENLLGENGKLIGFDPLPDRVALANSKNRYSNGHFAVGQAEDLSSIADSSVDVVYLSSVFHWVEDKPKALREIFRVLKPGGKVGLTTAAREFQSQGHVRQVVDRVLSRPPFVGEVKLEEAISNRIHVTSTELVQLFLDADLELVSLELWNSSRKHAKASSVLDSSEASSFGNFLAHVPPRLRSQARYDIEKELNREAAGKPIVIDNHALAAIARKPVR